MSRTYKCRYKYCNHETTNIPAGEEVQDGKSRFHEDCLHEKQIKQQIAHLFADKINTNVVHSQLNAVINNIVNEKGVSADFLLYGLQYFIDHRMTLNYPQGLYYVIQNVEVKKEYDKKQTMQIKSLINIDTTDKESSFTYKPEKAKGFGDILGG